MKGFMALSSPKAVGIGMGSGKLASATGRQCPPKAAKPSCTCVSRGVIKPAGGRNKRNEPVFLICLRLQTKPLVTLSGSEGPPPEKKAGFGF